METVLLDTMAAAGVLAINNNTGKGDAWKKCILSLLSTLPKWSVVIPTSVFYELAARDKEWLRFCLEKAKIRPQKGIFQYANHSITSDMLQAAAAYRLLCDPKDSSDDEKPRQQRISFGDSILAAYCLIYGYHLVTINQKDFSPIFFDVVGMCLAPMPNKKSERRVIYFLRPRTVEWNIEFTKLKTA